MGKAPTTLDYSQAYFVLYGWPDSQKDGGGDGSKSPKTDAGGPPSGNAPGAAPATPSPPPEVPPPPKAAPPSNPVPPKQTTEAPSDGTSSTPTPPATDDMPKVAPIFEQILPKKPTQKSPDGTTSTPQEPTVAPIFGEILPKSKPSQSTDTAPVEIVQDTPPQKEDPAHPDIYVPSNWVPGQTQYLMRWDEKAENYAVIGTKQGDGNWAMLDKENYKKTNNPQLEKYEAYYVPPEESERYPDFYYPPTGETKQIIRWDVKNDEYIVVGENKNGKDTYYPNRQVIAYATSAFKTNYPNFRPPLQEPLKGDIPDFGNSAEHPSFFGPASNGDGKTYAWAWNDKYQRYVAIGTIENDGKTVKMWGYSEYRKNNKDFDGLRPPEDQIPKPLPEMDPYGPQDTTHFVPPKEITVMIPPRPGKDQMQPVTGNAIYRKDKNTGELIISGIVIKGDQAAKPPVPDRYYYFRPDEFALYNPGGKAKEDLESGKQVQPWQEYKTKYDKDHPAPYKEGATPWPSTISAVVHWAEDNRYKVEWSNVEPGLVTITFPSGEKVSLDDSRPLDKETMDKLKNAGFPLDEAP